MSDKLTQIIDPKQFVFPDGFTIETIKHAWTDDANKPKDKDEFQMRNAKHKFLIKYDLSGVVLQDLLERVFKKTSSPTVSVQQKVRNIYKDDGDEFIEGLPDSEKVITISVAEMVARKKKQPEPVKTAKTNVKKITVKEELNEVILTAQARLKELESMGQ